MPTLAERLGFAASDRVAIVHADDIGMCNAANEGSFEALENGVVSCGSIMVPCPWFRAAADRARYLTRAYADMVADQDRLLQVIGLLRPLHAQEVIADWQAMATAGAFADLAESLMARHYDPRYAKHRARMEVRLAEVDAGPLSADALPAAAGRVAAAVASLI